MGKKVAQIFLPKLPSFCATFFKKTLDILIPLWYYISVKRRGVAKASVRHITEHLVRLCALWSWNVMNNNPPCKARKNFLRNFKKPLDKKHKMCYNISVKGRERKPSRVRKQSPMRKKIFEKVFKNPLTNRLTYDII